MLICLAVITACSGGLTKYKTAQAKDGKIVIPLSEVADKKVHFYSYFGKDRQINFFVRTDSKGNVSAYFDACYVCHKDKKGYKQEGDDLICNKCGMRFGIADEKWDEKNGCNPIHIKSSIENNSLIIETSVIEKGSKLF